MNFPVLHSECTPDKSLSLEEYIDFVGFFLQDTDIHLLNAQKSPEEHITEPFSLYEKKKSHKTVTKEKSDRL